MNVIRKIILGSSAVLLLSCDEGGRLGGGGSSAGGFTTNKLLIQMDLEEMFDDEGVRSLAEAAGRGNIRRIDELVASGVNVNYVGGAGATPLLWGIKNYRGFNRLLELGANPNAVYKDGSTLMYWAVMHEDIRFLQAALAHGGDPNLRDRSYFQYTPLFTALSKGQSKIDLLLKAEAEINAKDAFGGTPMMVAAGRGDFDVVAHLLSRGADPKLKDRAGDSLKSRINKLEGALVADSEREKWRQIVIQDLKRRGIM